MRWRQKIIKREDWPLICQLMHSGQVQPSPMIMLRINVERSDWVTLAVGLRQSSSHIAMIPDPPGSGLPVYLMGSSIGAIETVFKWLLSTTSFQGNRHLPASSSARYGIAS